MRLAWRCGARLVGNACRDLEGQELPAAFEVETLAQCQERLLEGDGLELSTVF